MTEYKSVYPIVDGSVTTNANIYAFASPNMYLAGGYGGAGGSSGTYEISYKGVKISRPSALQTAFNERLEAECAMEDQVAEAEAMAEEMTKPAPRDLRLKDISRVQDFLDYAVDNSLSVGWIEVSAKIYQSLRYADLFSQSPFNDYYAGFILVTKHDAEPDYVMIHTAKEDIPGFTRQKTL